MYIRIRMYIYGRDIYVLVYTKMNETSLEKKCEMLKRKGEAKLWVSRDQFIERLTTINLLPIYCNKG